MISGGGTWAGKQNGTLAGNAYQGAATITPTLPGTYTYALTCGGTMSASATLTVSKNQSDLRSVLLPVLLHRHLSSYG